MSLAFSSFKSSNVKTITVEDRVRKKRWALEHEDDAVRAGRWAGISPGSLGPENTWTVVLGGGILMTRKSECL